MRPEIDHHTIKLIVGVIAVSLANLTNFFSATPIPSISASYHEGAWAQSIFVGFLFAISALLLAYNGKSRREMIASKIAAVAALGVAMFPCRCGNHIEIIPYVHGISAAVMFLILAFFCYEFFKRARRKGHPQAKLRAGIYAFSGVVIVLCILILAVDNLSNGVISSKVERLTFYGEGTALMAFGVSWLTASRSMPLVTRKDERLSPFSDS